MSFPLVMMQAVASQPPGAIPAAQNATAPTVYNIPPGFIAIQPSLFWSVGLGFGVLFAAVGLGLYVGGKVFWQRNRVRIFWRGDAARVFKEEWVKRNGEEFHKRFGDKDGQVLLDPDANYPTTGALGFLVPTWFIDQTTGLGFAFESNAERFAKNPALLIAAQSNPLSYFDHCMENMAMDVHTANKPEKKAFPIMWVAGLGLLLLGVVGFIAVKFLHR